MISTGRSGTGTLAATLSQSPSLHCGHETTRELIRLSMERAHHDRAPEDVERELRALYEHRAAAPGESRHQGESDHHAFNLVEMLARVLPGSRYVWLVRDGREVVASAAARGWYGSALRREDPGRFPLREYYEFYRVRGDLCGEVEAAEWAGMSPFERCCWYWSYVNRTIGAQLRALPRRRWTAVRLERLEEEVGRVVELLDARPFPFSVEHENRADYSVRRHPEWTAGEHAAFARWCGDEMDRWYPGWR